MAHFFPSSSNFGGLAAGAAAFGPLAGGDPALGLEARIILKNILILPKRPQRPKRLYNIEPDIDDFFPASMRSTLLVRNRLNNFPCQHVDNLSSIVQIRNGKLLTLFVNLVSK